MADFAASLLLHGLHLQVPVLEFKRFKILFRLVGWPSEAEKGALEIKLKTPWSYDFGRL